LQLLILSTERDNTLPANNRALKVFLCHANEDKSKVRKLHRFLVSNGIDAWLDEESLRPGQEWRVEIPKVVREADVVMICLSSISARKEGFVQAEINIALDKAKEKPEGKIYIIPAKLEECAIPDKLSRWQWVNLFEKDGYNKLLDTLSFCAGEIDVTMPKVAAQGNSEFVQRKVAKKPKENRGSQKNSDEAQVRNILKIEGGVIVVGNVVDSSIIHGNENVIEVSRRNDGGSETKINISVRSEKLVSDRVLKSWLSEHGLVSNPFGDYDLINYPHYPDGAAWPNRWEAFLDPVSLFALCPTPEDAQALSYLLRKECLSLNKGEVAGGAKRWIFPLWFSHQQTVSAQSPLLALAHSAAQTWLDFLPQNSDKLLGLPQAKQNALFELLYWSLGSANTIINLLQSNSLDEDTNGLSLILKIEKYAKDLSIPPVPRDAILLSWLKLRPLNYNSTYLILFLDAIPVSMRSLWLEQINLLIPPLSVNGIITKAISSTELSGESPLSLTRLVWPDTQLKSSLSSQFNLAVEIDVVTKKREIKTEFNDLFGPFGSVSERDTTEKLISVSRNSLARMLMLGNRLLQYHCENRTKDGVPEKYLYTDDLETILNSA